MSKPFEFKAFEVHQAGASMKVGTDGVLLGAWTPTTGDQHILDIGTGTGLIALMLAQRNPKASITAIDIHEPSVNLALYNFSRSTFTNPMIALEASLQEYSKMAKLKFDLIVSNPPFFTSGTKASVKARQEARHNTTLPFDVLIEQVRNLLTAQGLFTVVLPFEVSDSFVELAIKYGLYLKKWTKVKSKASKPFERSLFCFGLQKVTPMVDELVLNHEQGRNNWTSAYKALTSDFYTII